MGPGGAPGGTPAPMGDVMQPPVQGTPNAALPAPAQAPVDPATGQPFGGGQQ